MSKYDPFKETPAERAARLREQAVVRDSKPEADASGGISKAPGIREGLVALGYIARYAGVGMAIGKAAWNNVLGPVWNFVSPPVSAVYRAYRDNIWKPLVYVKNEQGEETFSTKRAGIVLTSTFAAAVMAVPVGMVGYDATLMATTMRDKTVYLHTADLNAADVTARSYRFEGSETDGQREVGNSINYNAEASIARHAWSLINKGTLYRPRHLASTVEPGLNKCDVKIYGAYYEKTMQNFDRYPHLLDISCVRIGDFNAASTGNAVPTPAPVPAAPSGQQMPAP